MLAPPQYPSIHLLQQKSFLIGIRAGSQNMFPFEVGSSSSAVIAERFIPPAESKSERVFLGPKVQLAVSVKSKKSAMVEL